MSAVSGILLVDKPQGITSHGVVSRTRKLAGTRKVGHAGTLDPMATGLLVLGLNSSTRLLTYLVGLDKEYFATIRLGAATTTDDAEGETVAAADATGVQRSAIDAGIALLRGTIDQVPSSVSAIKVDGKRAYDRVREGEIVELRSRSVTISTFEVLAVREAAPFVDVDVRVECSSGTYIRALARDLGAYLEVGGHLTALRRSRVGPFAVERAATLDDLDPAGQLLTPADVATTLFAPLPVSAAHVTDLVHGKRISVDVDDGAPLAAISPDGTLIGLVSVSRGVAKSIINFPTDEVQA